MKYFKLLLLVIVAFCICSVQIICAQDYEYGLGDIPLEDLYNKHLRRKAFLDSNLPESYDARNDGIVTSAKNQYSCGSCWAFTLVGALESKILMESGVEYDLSEQQLISLNTYSYGCEGGNAAAVQYWGESSPNYESCFPYDPYGSKSESCNEDLGYRTYDLHEVNNNEFKNSLYEDGPGYFRFNVHKDFFTFWYNTYNPGGVYVQERNDYEGGHAVLLIGWDDDKEAYLCKNSWGATGGPNGDGTFWIAYDNTDNLGFKMYNFNIIKGVVPNIDYDVGGCFISVL